MATATGPRRAGASAPVQPSVISLVARERGRGARFDLLFLGDTSFGETYQESRERKGKENILKARGYEASLEVMKSILTAADFVVANLETPVTDLAESPYSGEKRYIHKGDPATTPRILRQSRVAAVSLANNHSFDYGAAGLEQTLGVLKAEGITCFGAGLSKSQADEPLLLELGRDEGALRIALFAVQGGAAGAKANDGQEAIDGAQIGLLHTERIAGQIGRLTATYPDLLTIAFPHWGRNYAWRSDRQARQADALFGAGIDLILGHGAHMLQQVEARAGKWAAFSLGNFVFNSPGRYAQHGVPPFSLVARLVARPGLPKWSVSLRLFPIVTDNRLTDYRTRFVNDEEFKAVRDLIAMKSPDLSLREGKDSNGRYLRFRVRFGPKAGQN